MITSTEDRASDQARRLRLKTQEHRLQRLVVEGTSVSPWEAEVLVDVVQEVYFSEPKDRPMQVGQMRYAYVAATEGAGKPLAACGLQTVVLTVQAKEDIQIGARQGQAGLRRHRVLRLSEEAREQGGLLTQEDLALVLMSDVRTVRRDIGALRRDGIVVATRGQQKDIGPGVTHRGVAIRHWLEGQEPVAVARQIRHSLQATERYIQHFCRVVFLCRKGFVALQIALTVGTSLGSVHTYLDIYHAIKHKAVYNRRLDELEVVGATHYEAQDEKKGVRSRRGKSAGERRQP